MSQGPWEKHLYVKVQDGKYFYPDNYEGGRHLPDGETRAHKVIKKIETNEKNSSSNSEKEKTSTSTASNTKKDGSDPKLEDRTVKNTKNLGLFTAKDLRKKSGKTISELEKLLAESRSERTLDLKKANERASSAVSKVSDNSLNSYDSNISSAASKVVDKIGNTVVNEGPNLDVVYSVYDKKR